MMDAVRVHTEVVEDGRITVTGLPFRRGQRLELIVLAEEGLPPTRRPSTARALLNSGLVGVWKDREDIGDSTVFARELRERAQRLPG